MKNKFDNTLLDTVNYLANNGNTEMALKIVKASLEKLYYDNNNKEINERTEEELDFYYKFEKERSKTCEI